MAKMAKLLSIFVNIFVLTEVFLFVLGMSLTNQKATVGQFPYMIYLTILKSPGNSFSCGGSLLTRNFGLTAAHCLTFEQDNKTQMAEAAHAFMGIVDLMGPEEFEIYRKVTEMIIHENYQIFGDQDYTFHDIALIRFESPVDFCSRVQPITLPDGQIRTRSFVKAFVTGMGWGMTTSGFTSTDLLYATSMIINNKKCQKKYNRAEKNYVITEEMICVVPAGSNPRAGACMGDSGGPLILYGTSILVGIASWTEVQENCTKKFPDAFTRVTKYIDWIKEHVDESDIWYKYGEHNQTQECPKSIPEPIETTEVSSTPEKSNTVAVFNHITTQISI
ncbi:collagenase-like [Culicoides brevitarsis]|uniref:collagenase-like n=1 Tax=Culicoides brevitarsis TaxID=469753 RepID=UPI00307C073A